jgi:hypothetical protein
MRTIKFVRFKYDSYHQTVHQDVKSEADHQMIHRTWKIVCRGFDNMELTDPMDKDTCSFNELIKWVIGTCAGCLEFP